MNIEGGKEINLSKMAARKKLKSDRPTSDEFINLIEANKKECELFTTIMPFMESQSIRHMRNIRPRLEVIDCETNKKNEEGILHEKNIGRRHRHRVHEKLVLASDGPYVTAAFVKIKDRVDKWFESSRCVLVYGGSGVGKTTFAGFYGAHHASLKTSKFQVCFLANVVNLIEGKKLNREDFFNLFANLLHLCWQAPTLIIIDQLDLSSIPALEALFADSTLRLLTGYKASLFIIGSGHSVPHDKLPDMLKNANQHGGIFKFVTLKFHLTKAEFHSLLPDLGATGLDHPEKSTFKTLFHSLSTTSIGQIVTSFHCADARTEFKCDLHEIMGGMVEKIFASHGQDLAVTKCIKFADFKETRATRALIESSHILPYRGDWEEVTFHDELVVSLFENSNVEFILPADDGEHLCAFLCEEPNLLNQKLKESSREYCRLRAETDAQLENNSKKGTLFEALFFLDLYYAGVLFECVQAYKAVNWMSKRAGSMQGILKYVLVQHPCIEAVVMKMEDILKVDKRPCWMCESDSEMHSVCFFGNVNRHRPNFKGWDYIHFSEKHHARKSIGGGPKNRLKEITCVQLFQITVVSESHKTSEMLATYNDLLKDLIDDAKNKKVERAHVEMFWIMDADLNMRKTIGDDIPVVKIIKKPMMSIYPS